MDGFHDVTALVMPRSYGLQSQSRVSNKTRFRFLFDAASRFVRRDAFDVVKTCSLGGGTHEARDTHQYPIRGYYPPAG